MFTDKIYIVYYHLTWNTCLYTIFFIQLPLKQKNRLSFLFKGILVCILFFVFFVYYFLYFLYIITIEAEESVVISVQRIFVYFFSMKNSDEKTTIQSKFVFVYMF
jgi:hypothetical protein